MRTRKLKPMETCMTIRSKVPSKEFKENYDKIFGKKKPEPKKKEPK